VWITAWLGKKQGGEPVTSYLARQHWKIALTCGQTCPFSVTQQRIDARRKSGSSAYKTIVPCVCGCVSFFFSFSLSSLSSLFSFKFLICCPSYLPFYWDYINFLFFSFKNHIILIHMYYFTWTVNTI
jgi:hypothetical protein